jgi:hypothetical protein
LLIFPITVTFHFFLVIIHYKPISLKLIQTIFCMSTTSNFRLSVQKAKTKNSMIVIIQNHHNSRKKAPFSKTALFISNSTVSFQQLHQE